MFGIVTESTLVTVGACASLKVIAHIFAVVVVQFYAVIAQTNFGRTKVIATVFVTLVTLGTIPL